MKTTLRSHPSTISQPREPLPPDTSPAGNVTSAPAPRRPRVLGVDVARGVALVGMIAVHILPDFTSDGAPTVTTIVAAGRSAATFVLIAGVSLTFLSGGRTVVQGRARTAVSAGLAVRAVLIGAIGLALGLLAPLNNIDGILPHYGLMFLVAIAMLGLAPLALGGVAVAAIVLGPVLLLATADGLPSPDGDPSLATLVHDPLGLLVQLTVTGSYPLVVFIAYLCAGLAIGRLDLTSRRVAWWLFGGGVALAAMAQVVSAIILYPLGGLARLAAEGGLPDGGKALLWDPQGATSWWYLALPAPQSFTPVDLANTLGSAIAVLGAALLLTRVPAIARLLRPLAVAGSMVLTLYSAHLVILATGVLQDNSELLFLLMVAGALVFAGLWQRWFGHGPLERIVTVAAGQARRATTRLLAEPPSTTAGTTGNTRRVSTKVIRGTRQLMRPLAIAGALALAFWAGARSTPPVPDSPPVAVGPGTAATGPNPDRYCVLSGQLDDITAQYPDQPKAVLGKVAPMLDEMARVAPVEIRDAVLTEIAHVRVQGADPAVAGPNVAAVNRADTTLTAFDDENC
ncbi:heparan-alpha-glucosaminide N-acetyltransferase domain-containing protein [Pseudonocardia sp.]|uniref:heparan-alpha-glucosaminide N-acetyltransferase domain-containing protein n=1 Tax=Pseudonocardia sp. TaxID=60912 RepID=UPI0031FDAB15